MKTYTMELHGGHITATVREDDTHVSVVIDADDTIHPNLHGFIRETIADVFFMAQAHAEEIGCQTEGKFRAIFDAFLHDAFFVQRAARRVALASMAATAISAVV